MYVRGAAHSYTSFVCPLVHLEKKRGRHQTPVRAVDNLIDALRTINMCHVNHKLVVTDHGCGMDSESLPAISVAVI